MARAQVVATGPGVTVGIGVVGKQLLQTPGPVGEPGPVLRATDALVDDHRRRMGQTQRQISQIAGQVARLVEEVVGKGVCERGEPVSQEHLGLGRGVHADVDHPPAATGQGAVTPAGGHHQPAPTSRPQSCQVRGITKVVDHHQPGLVGGGEEPQETSSKSLGPQVPVGQIEPQGSLGKPGQDRGPRFALHPHPQIGIAGLDQPGGDLGLADPTITRQHLPQPDPGVAGHLLQDAGPGLEGRRQRRRRPNQHRPADLTPRRHHIDGVVTAADHTHLGPIRYRHRRQRPTRHEGRPIMLGSYPPAAGRGGLSPM
jgi:hypothetical protein